MPLVENCGYAKSCIDCLLDVGYCKAKAGEIPAVKRFSFANLSERWTLRAHGGRARWCFSEARASEIALEMLEQNPDNRVIVHHIVTSGYTMRLANAKRRGGKRP